MGSKLQYHCHPYSLSFLSLSFFLSPVFPKNYSFHTGTRDLLAPINSSFDHWHRSHIIFLLNMAMDFLFSLLPSWLFQGNADKSNISTSTTSFFRKPPPSFFYQQQSMANNWICVILAMQCFTLLFHKWQSYTGNGLQCFTLLFHCIPQMTKLHWERFP